MKQSDLSPSCARAGFRSCLFLAWSVIGSFQGAAAATAIHADDFLNSLGVNTAVSRRGERLEDTLKSIQYLGVRWIRTGYESQIPVSDLIELHRQIGVRFSYGRLSGGTDIERLLQGARQLASAGALLAVEGNNEPNNWTITHLGLRGGGMQSWLPVARLQRDLYRAVKDDPVLKDYPVWSLSETGAQTENVGLQFLVIPPGSGTLMPEGTRYADFANCHNYVMHNHWPGLHDNQTWIAADPTSAGRVDGLFGNYGRTWRHQYAGYSETELRALPRVTTETGARIECPVTEKTQGRLWMSLYLDQFRRGWSHTAVYLLRDRTDEEGNQTYGFFRPDYMPRLGATYIHNLTAVLSGDGPRRPLANLDYSIHPQPSTVHDLLLQKSDGRLALVVWSERFTGGSDLVTVDLGARYDSVRLFDPTEGATATLNLSDVNAVKVTLTDHPLILELDSAR
jgi:hypothetical protein